MRKVALVGFSAKSNGPAYSLPEDVELWSLNHAHRFGFPRLDRMFEMHHPAHIRSKNYYTPERQTEHIKWLRSKHEFPIYMQANYRRFPASVEYPLIDVLSLHPAAIEHMTSSFAYMIGLAVLERVDWIGCYGFDMDTRTEYEYQREGALWWIGFAEGRGIDVYIPPESSLKRKVKLYAYQGTAMVTRQTLEFHKESAERQMKEALLNQSRWEGILIERANNGAGQREIEDAQMHVEGYMRTAAMAEGAMKQIEMLIDTCDMEEFEPQLNADILAMLEAA